MRRTAGSVMLSQPGPPVLFQVADGGAGRQITSKLSPQLRLRYCRQRLFDRADLNRAQPFLRRGDRLRGEVRRHRFIARFRFVQQLTGAHQHDIGRQRRQHLLQHLNGGGMRVTDGDGVPAALCYLHRPAELAPDIGDVLGIVQKHLAFEYLDAGACRRPAGLMVMLSRK